MELIRIGFKFIYDLLIAPGEIFWVAVSAIASFFVVIVALWKENLHPEPDLILEGENLGGVAVGLGEGGRTPSCYYHLRVVNKKPRVLAKNVRVLVLSIDFENAQIPSRRLHPPRQLAWAPAELGEISPMISRFRTLDLLRIVPFFTEVTLLSASWAQEHIIPWGENARISLEIVADNFSRKCTYEVILTWLGARPTIEVFTARRTGYIRLALNKTIDHPWGLNANRERWSSFLAFIKPKHSWWPIVISSAVAIGLATLLYFQTEYYNRPIPNARLDENLKVVIENNGNAPIKIADGGFSVVLSGDQPKVLKTNFFPTMTVLEKGSPHQFLIDYDYSKLPSSNVLWIPVVVCSTSLKQTYKVAFFCELGQNRQNWLRTEPGPQQNLAAGDKEFVQLLWKQLEEAVASHNKKLPSKPSGTG